MTKYIAISNRRGGVGKTTLTMMLAYGLAAGNHQRVLVIDLDPQSSSSIVIMGRERLNLARSRGHTAANVLERMTHEHAVVAADFIEAGVGDVLLPNNRWPHLDIIAGSHQLDDRETEFVIGSASRHGSIAKMFDALQIRIGEIIRTVDGLYDQVLIDCAPGLSHLVWGALRTADHILIPYVPDQTAADNVDWLCKRLDNLGKRGKYRTVANRVSGHSAIGIASAIEAVHSSLGIRIATSQPLSSALDYRFMPGSQATKFNSANTAVRTLADATLSWINNTAEAA